MIIKRELWTIYFDVGEDEILAIDIYNNQTLLELKNKVSKEIKWNVQDIVLIGRTEYGKNYYSKQIKDIDDFHNEMTLFVV